MRRVWRSIPVIMRPFVLLLVLVLLTVTCVGILAGEDEGTLLLHFQIKGDPRSIMRWDADIFTERGLYGYVEMAAMEELEEVEFPLGVHQVQVSVLFRTEEGRIVERLATQAILITAEHTDEVWFIIDTSEPSITPGRDFPPEAD